jgi:uncharacterized protein YbjT (DUF2867 family)
LVSQALDAGHQVTAYVRDPRKLAKTHAQLKVVEGQVTDQGGLKKALEGQEFVLSALGLKGLGDKSGFLTRGIQGVIQAMKDSHVPRLVYLSTYGIGGTDQDMGFLFSKILIPLLLKNVAADHTGAEKAVRESGLEWVIARPARLTNGPLTGKYLTEERLGKNTANKISRADVAHFMLAQAAGERWLGKAVGLAYPS